MDNAELGTKGFLLLKKSYKVRCLNCNFIGKAVVGKDAVEPDREEYCPVCNHAALLTEEEYRRRKLNERN